MADTCGVSRFKPFVVLAQNGYDYDNPFKCKYSERLIREEVAWRRNSAMGFHFTSRCATITSCPNGGIGRRASFRSWFSQGSGGSSPLSGTKAFSPSFALPSGRLCQTSHRRQQALHTVGLIEFVWANGPPLWISRRCRKTRSAADGLSTKHRCGTILDLRHRAA
jgi:hypothetical protein